MSVSPVSDTICAPASSVGGGAVSIIRLSGPKCFPVLDSLLDFAHGDAASSPGYRLKRGEFADVDDVLVGIFRAPHSYTGEDAAEIYCHASPYIVSRILDLLCAHGCRMAEPGEFTRRAFLNGKMDLAQAEAVVDVIAAQSEAQLRVAGQQLRGGYSRELREIRASLVELSALVELELDFSEEDVEFADRGRLRELLDTATKRCRTLCDSFRAGNAIRNGVPVAIAGAPNSGKSTLLNALLSDDRAIVSPIPGTTRDTIEEVCVVGGTLLRFIDTAGLRESGDTIERMGIERSRAKIREAYVVLGVLDATLPAEELLAQAYELESWMSGGEQKLVLLLNKLDVAGGAGAVAGSDDLVETAEPAESAEFINKNVIDVNNFVSLINNKGINAIVLEISAKTGLGLEKLRECLSRICSPDSENELLVTNARHAEALRVSADALGKVASGLDLQRPTDLLAEDLREAISSLGSITGEISSDEVLGEIFGRFCIGK